ncbi:MAG: alanine dehydrogenase [Cellvibrionaceae bacterium]|nr:alanine dehydrogenase [Cellvibrionaceae bacterium]
MKIGVPKEIKNHEYRVALIPAAVAELSPTHAVYVEKNAGAAIGFSDQHYRDAGAIIVDSASAIFAEADMIIKVKEPQATERAQLQAHHIVFTYLHLASDPEQTQDLIDSKATCIAYETVSSASGQLPLLAPMSEVAGRMSVQAGAHHLEKAQGGRGVLLGGVPGVSAAKLVIIGGGVAGTHAAQMAIGLGAQVTILDNNIERLRQLNQQLGAGVQLLYASQQALDTAVVEADLVIGSVLIPGAAAPKLVSSAQLGAMKPGAVLVDIAIDQGGCFASSKPTSHEQPTFIEKDVVHYCVTNMPGAVPRTASIALNNVTLPYIKALANKGWRQALSENGHLRNGLNVCQGNITHQAVADSLNYPYVPPQNIISDC